jgi:hypothetical protein
MDRERFAGMIPLHPFERLTVEQLRLGSLILAAAAIVLTALLAYAVPADDLSRIFAGLTSSWTAAGLQEVVRAWPERTRLSATFLFGFDTLFDVVHNNAVAFLCVWAARRNGTASALVTARTLAWIMWLDTLLNQVEDLVFLEIVRGAPADPWPALAVGIAGFRSITLAVGFLFGATLLAWERHRSHGRR